MGKSFQDLPSDGRAYFKSSQDAVDLLAGITAADKALSVPYLKIWQIYDDGTPVHGDSQGNSAGISFLLTTPPAFGSPVDQVIRFQERPPVSLERVSVKTEMSYGIIQFRKVEMSFVVHRPDIVFDESNEDFDNWSSLMLPGAMHAMEYGWTGQSTNDVVNGNGFQDARTGVDVEGTRTLIFTVVNYSFTIGPTGEIRIAIHALESGDNAMGKVSLSDVDFFDGKNDKATTPLVGRELREYNTETGRDLLRNMQRAFDQLSRTKVQKLGTMVVFREILDKIFAPALEAAFRRSGFSDMDFFVGRFNKKAGRTKKMYGGDMGSGGQNENGEGDAKSIADFQFPEQVINDILGELRRDGAQMNVRNLLENFLSQIQSSNAWETGLTDDEKKQLKDQANGDQGRFETLQAALIDGRKHPDMKIKVSSIKKKGKHKLLFYIVDLQRELVDFNFSDQDRLGPKATRDQIVRKLRDKNMPLITFRNGLSYIQDANFEVQQDPLIKTIMIQQVFSQNRQELTKQSHASLLDGKIDPRQLIYSSAIDGSMTMLGNFVFDTFALVWLEFGVPRWDGPFFVMEKEDIVTRGEFLSTFRYKSAGNDPLDTQGRITAEKLAQAQAAQQQQNSKKAGTKNKPGTTIPQ